MNVKSTFSVLYVEQLDDILVILLLSVQVLPCCKMLFSVCQTVPYGICYIKHFLFNYCPAGLWRSALYADCTADNLYRSAWDEDRFCSHWSQSTFNVDFLQIQFIVLYTVLNATDETYSTICIVCRTMDVAACLAVAAWLHWYLCHWLE